MSHTQKKLFIISYLHQSNEVYSNDKHQTIIQDAIIEDDINILQTEIDSTKFWERRIIASDKMDYTSRKFFVEWNISHALGLIKKPIYCKIITQNAKDSNQEITIEKRKFQNKPAQQKTINVVDIEKIPLANIDDSFSFDEADFSADSKIIVNVELDIGQSKIKQDYVLYAKSLIEIHKRHFLEINELPNWNQIRYRVFENINDRFLSIVLEKGMKKPHYKALIEDNFGHFKEYFRKKTHQIINEILANANNYQTLLTENRNLLLATEKEFRPQIIAQQSPKAVELLVKTINKKIAYSNLTLLSEALSKIILSSIPIKEQLLKHFNEFLYFLIVF